MYMDWHARYKKVARVEYTKGEREKKDSLKTMGEN